MTWAQVYDPFGAWWLSTLVASLPVVVLLGLLAVFQVKPHWAAIAGATTAVLAASLVFKMPWPLSAASLCYGAAFGLLKIAWIVVAAVFLYDISVYTGQFDIMKQSVARITADRRLQALLVAFCFGAIIEGAAGFGAPVAIAGAFMIGLGFKPFHAAALNLIANTAPVAWGAIGTPVHTLAAVSGLPEAQLNAMIGRILPITALLVPFWLVRAMVGWRETLEVLPAILVVGGSFATTQFVWSNFIDSNLVDIASGVASLLAAVVFLRFWQPRRVWRFSDDHDGGEAEPLTSVVGEPSTNSAERAIEVHSSHQIARAWIPFVILALFVLLWGLPPIKNRLNTWTTPAYEQGGWDVPILHLAVSRSAPVVTHLEREKAKFDFNWLSATGSGCFLAALVSGVFLGMAPFEMAKVFWRTLVRMRFAVIAISFMLGRATRVWTRCLGWRLLAPVGCIRFSEPFLAGLASP
jgi:lactate permease